MIFIDIFLNLFNIYNTTCGSLLTKNGYAREVAIELSVSIKTVELTESLDTYIL